MDNTITAEKSQFVAEARNKLFKMPVKWPAIFIVTAFCIYRLAVFTPEPLDSAATLRPFLYRISSWCLHFYGTPEKLFDHWRNDCFFALFIPPGLAFLHCLWRQEAIRLPSRFGDLVSSRWLFFGSIAGCLLLCRFPILLQNQINPDEGEFLYAAHKLFFNGNFFAAVDCHTSGPFNAYSLMLPAIFGLSPDYASSRTVGLLTIMLCLYLLYRAFALILPDEIARLAIVPTAAAFCVFNNTDFLHMNSEHIPLLWIAIAIYLNVRVLRDPHSHRNALFLLGLMVSAAFFTKVQSVPVAAAVAAVAVIYVHASGYAGKLWRPSLYVVAGTLPLLLVNALLCTVAGVWRDFWIGYLVSNWTYSFTEGTFATNVTGFLSYAFFPDEIRLLIFNLLAFGAILFFQKVRLNRIKDETAFVQMVAVAGLAVGTAIFLRENLSARYVYLVYSCMAALAVYLLVYVRASYVGLDRVRWLGILAATSIAAALYAIYKPHRGFYHYLFFLILPLCTAMAWLLMRQHEASVANFGDPTSGVRSQTPRIHRAIASMSVFITLTVAYQTFIWSQQTSVPLKNIVATIRPPEGDFIRSLTSPGAQIRVWGWTAGPYLGSGREGEGKDTHVLYCFRQDRFQRYYLNRFLKDMQHRPPDVFIDAIGPASWSLTDRKAFNFEQFPGIAGFIQANYVHLTDLYEQRFFLRRDLAARREALFSTPLTPKTCSPDALSCLATPITLPKDLPAVHMPQHALLEAEFMPVQSQIGPATVFNNEAEPNSYRGFRFQHTTGDRYLLLVGTGNAWVGSKEITLRAREPVSLRIEFDGSTVRLWCNNSQPDQLHLPHPMADSPGPLNLNSWIGSADPFAGKLQFFQIVDLQKREQDSNPPSDPGHLEGGARVSRHFSRRR